MGVPLEWQYRGDNRAISSCQLEWTLREPGNTWPAANRIDLISPLQMPSDGKRRADRHFESGERHVINSQSDGYFVMKD